MVRQASPRAARANDSGADQELVGIVVPLPVSEAAESAPCQEWGIFEASTLAVCERSKPPSRAAPEKKCIVIWV